VSARVIADVATARVTTLQGTCEMTGTDWTSADMPDQTGRVAIVTGANSGLGLAATRALAAAGATTVLACRSIGNAERARQDILAGSPGSRLEIAELDVASLQSVRAFAAEMQRRFSAIDLLINNAGIMAIPSQRSPDGFELQFATNHLGHFALTGLLLPQLSVRGGGRIVAVSSIAARSGRIDFDDLMGERRYDPWKAYNQSKLANLMFVLELQRRLAQARLPAIAVAAHPGASTTGLFSTAGGYFVKRVVSPVMMRFLFHSAEAGALPILYAATSPEAQPAGFYGPRGFQEMKGPPAPAVVPRQALDEGVAQRLWQVSERLAGIAYP
jgi:NAD(P)-dependent dehydrogenase (short-subunit alcohol dehydrogenase family)